MIITTSDFVGDITISGVENTLDGVATRLDAAIIKYEPKYLKMILGQILYDEFKLALEQAVVLAKWTELEGYLKESTAYYIYCKYQEKKGTESTSVGEVISSTENSTRASQDARFATIWNDMITLSKEALLEIEKSVSLYEPVSTLYISYKNRFGL